MAQAPANVWKWRDETGRLTISDQAPPPSVPERDIVERPPAPAPARRTAHSSALPASSPATPLPVPGASPVAPGRSDSELEARRRAQAAQQRERAAAAKAAEESQAQQLEQRRRENCSRARAALAQLDSGQRITRLGDKGERVVLDEAQRAQEARRAREVMAAECG